MSATPERFTTSRGMLLSAWSAYKHIQGSPCLGVSEFMAAGTAAHRLSIDPHDLSPTEDIDVCCLAAYWRDWRDVGFPVFELSKYAAQELLLTAPPKVWDHPAGIYFITLPTPDSIGTLRGLMVINERIGDDVATTFTPWDASGVALPNDSPWDRSPDGSMGVLQRLVSNLAAALTVRQDDLVAENLVYKKISKRPRPQVTRVRMRTPVVHLQPHIRRFLLEGERAFRGRRGSYVLGFFRRPPGGEQKTVWVRPHYRPGTMDAVCSAPKVTRVDA